jgi:hypothetical protein
MLDIISPQRRGFNSMTVRVGFVAGEVTLGQEFILAPVCTPRWRSG